VAVFERGPVDVFDAPRIKLAEAAKEFHSRRDHRLVGLSGKVESQPDDESIVLSDGDLQLTVNLKKKQKFTAGTSVDAVGIIWKAEDQEEFSLDFATARPSLKVDQEATDRGSELPVLRTVQSVRSLTPEMAAKKYSVEIRGVVTYYDPVWRNLFINDETGGIYVNEKSRALPVHLGERVLLRGESDPGGFSSMVIASRVQRIGKGKLPDPRTVPAARILSGAEDSQWISLTATVASAERTQKNLVLNLRGIQRDYPFQAVLCSGVKYLKSKNWVGSEIRITGVCGTKANANRQAVGVYFHIPGIEYVEFLNEANDDPFAVPKVAISDLLKFDSDAEERLNHVRISGVVTYADDSGQVAIQEGGRGILMRLRGPDSPQVGDQIDVIGYPILDSSQRLQAIDWRRRGEATLPNPLPITVAQITDNGLDGQFVSLEALLLRNNANSVSPGLSLQSNGTVFSADLSSKGADNRWANLHDGSSIRVEGVLDVVNDGWGDTQAFRLLCPSTANIELVRQAPWWNTTYAQILVAGLVFLVLASVLWVSTLRRAVNNQRTQINNELLVRTKLTERFNRLIENAGELIFSIRPDGQFVTANPATIRVLRSKIPDLVGCQITDFLTPQSVETLNASVSQLSKEHSKAEFELTTTEDVILESAVYMQPDATGEPQIQCIARDVSERRRLENQMRHMQKMESIGQLVAGIAHDYNNLMTVVLCNSELLLNLEEFEQQPSTTLCEIKDAAERASSLTQQLLAFSRRQIMSMRVLRPVELLGGLLDMLQRLLGESIQLDCDFEEEVPCIRADRGMLEQVIVNLAVNARDAMPHGGRLSFKLQKHHVSPEVSDHNINLRTGDYVQITVTDTGCGIEPDVLSNVFEPFYTSKEIGKGTGLGLSTAFGIIRQHKGWIDVESKIDVGTTFTIMLPVSLFGDAEQIEKSEYQPDVELPKGKETVLVVEDDPNVRQTITRLLGLHGYEIIQAGNGIEALETWHHMKNKIDIIITDMIMPSGMSGYTMAQEIRRIAPETPLIYCSGYSDEIAKLSALDTTERLLHKPFENQALLHLVRDLLDQPATVKS
ncbi:MAG: ATP-binding protein, partial [Planctomycetota bacterium]